MSDEHSILTTVVVGACAVGVVIMGTMVACVAKADDGRSRSYFTGQQLYKFCTADATLPFCSGYVAAVVDSVEGMAPHQCVPNEVTVGEAADTVTKWLKEHPAERHNGAAGLVLAAIADGFCPVKPASN